MRIVIFGAGAIGGTIGGHLARSGQDVLFVEVNPGHVKAIRENGLRLITPAGDLLAHVPVVTGPTQVDFRADDVVFFCLKGTYTESAVSALQKAVDDVPLFCFQNGMRNEETLARHFPRVYGVIVRVGASHLSDGEVVCQRDPPGWFIIGRYPSGTDALAEKVVQALRCAGFFAKTTSDFTPHKWGKLSLNLPNAVRAITDTGNEGIGPIIRAAQDELHALLTDAGIRWISDKDQIREWPEVAAPLRGKLVMKSRDSTWQSLVRGEGAVETEFLNGEVVRLAKRLGREAPVNETLLRIIQEMAANREKPGKYTPGQLCAILGLREAD